MGAGGAAGEAGRGPDAFPGTRLSVLRAAHAADPDVRRQAWEAIVAAYWKPAYKYFRLRWRAAPADAEDLTQGFFARAFEKSYFEPYEPARARFRTFLRTCLDAYVANERRQASRLKRGGGARPLDFAEAEEEVVRAAPAVDFEAFFQREFQRRVVEMAVESLREACAGTARATAFAVFHRRDVQGADAEAPPSYAELAGEFGLPVTQVTNHLAAMRRALRAEILQALRTLTATDEEYEAEARALLGAPARR